MYKIEFTDTFGGEANFGWIDRYIVSAANMKQAVTKVKQYRYNTPISRHRYIYNDNMSARIDIINHNVCAFIDLLDSDGIQEYKTDHKNVVVID